MAANNDRYALALRVLHWLMALMIVGLLSVGLIMTNMPRSNPLHTQLYTLHKSFGIMVLALFAVRLFFRLRLGAPALPSQIPALERSMAYLGHMGLYFFMFAMPFSGIIMTNSFGFSVPFFGMQLPKIVGIDKARGAFFAEIHEIMAYALIGLICLHVAGAIKHYEKEHINLFRRIV